MLKLEALLKKECLTLRSFLLRRFDHRQQDQLLILVSIQHISTCLLAQHCHFGKIIFSANKNIDCLASSSRRTRNLQVHPFLLASFDEISKNQGIPLQFLDPSETHI
jgi:hypothetical protein